MRIKEITVESLQSSMVAAKDVLDPNGRVLLAAGRLITPDLRLALQRYGIAKVYVQQQGRVNLSDGRRGVVAMLNSTNWALPVVRIADGWLDLLEETQVRIVHTEPGG